MDENFLGLTEFSITLDQFITEGRTLSSHISQVNTAMENKWNIDYLLAICYFIQRLRIIYFSLLMFIQAKLLLIFEYNLPI